MQEKKQRPSDGPAYDGLHARARQILDAAMGLFIEKGFHQTGMRDVARAAGVSLGNLYNHFSGKAEIIRCIALLEAYEQAPLISLLEKEGAPNAIIREFADRYFQWASAHENVVIGVEIAAEIYRDPAIGQPFVENRERLEAALARVLTKTQTGGVKNATPASARAAMMLELLTAAAERTAFAPRTNAKAIERLLEKMIAALL